MKEEGGVHSNGESCTDAIDHYTSDTTTAHENPSAAQAVLTHTLVAGHADRVQDLVLRLDIVDNSDPPLRLDSRSFLHESGFCDPNPVASCAHHPCWPVHVGLSAPAASALPHAERRRWQRNHQQLMHHPAPVQPGCHGRRPLPLALRHALPTARDRLPKRDT